MGVVIAANIPLYLAQKIEKHIDEGLDSNKNQIIIKALNEYLSKENNQCLKVLSKE